MEKYTKQHYLNIIKNKCNINDIDLHISNKSMETRITFKCDKHGESIWRWQNAKNKDTINCKKCSELERNLKYFNIELSNLNFELITPELYLGSKSKILVKCTIHGEIFLKTDRNTLLNKSTVCSLCQRDKYKEIYKNKFIEKAKIIHDDFYSYENINYIDVMSKIEIPCPKHGVFLQTPDAHIRGQKCPKCVISYKENYIKEILEKYKFEYVFNKGHKLLINPKTNYPLKPDFWLEKYNLVIEYDGISHFKQIYSKEGFERTQKLDVLKNKLCKKHKIKIWRFNKNNLYLLEKKLIKLYEIYNNK